MQVFLLALILIAIAVGGIAIKMFLIPGGSFKKSCGSATDPKTGKPLPCACASGKPEECENTDEKETVRETELQIKI